jgi:hypothetical protein
MVNGRGDYASPVFYFIGATQLPSPPDPLSRPLALGEGEKVVTGEQVPRPEGERLFTEGFRVRANIQVRKS